ncbi:MAG: hypothetical protein ACI93R_001302 [Flavobacteriales bacterium]|jgi:hypothetical protein
MKRRAKKRKEKERKGGLADVIPIDSRQRETYSTPNQKAPEAYQLEQQTF